MSDPAGGSRSAAAVTAILAGRPLRPIATPSRRPWAGRRLGPPAERIGERWLAGPWSAAVPATPATGRAAPEGGAPAGDAGVTLEELAVATGEALVGARAGRLAGPRFPLLAKLIDAGAWLSLQVHPDDAVAVELHGAGAVGKTEAWLVLAAEPGALLVIGPDPALGEERLRAAIAAGTLSRDACSTEPARAGDLLLVPAGTLHAIGAGTFVYELEQPSDLTYRVSDWGRATEPGRELHRREALRALDPSGRARRAGTSWRADGGRLDADVLRLEVETLPGAAPRRPAGGSVELVTVVDGAATVRGDGWAVELGEHETLVIPAACPGYELVGGPGRLCIGSIP